MPSQRYFNQCPAFPQEISVAEIPTVSLNQLQKNSQPETTRLFDACRHHGFFLLDLSDTEPGTALLQDAERMFDLAASTLSLPKPLLSRFAYKPPGDLIGYKAAGNLRTDDGGLDTTEMYTLGQDDILGTVTPPRKNPAPVEAQRAEARAFLLHAHAAVSTVLRALDHHLALPADTLTNLVALDSPSATGLRLLLTRPDASRQPRITLGAHTDIGVITLLFHVAGGLQVPSGEGGDVKGGDWRFVRPRSGCALVNLGDTLMEWTGGVLRSALHRVVTSPGEQSGVERVSLAYLVRPASDGTMARLKSEVIPVPGEGEEDGRTVDEWAAERAGQVGDGVLKPRIRGEAYGEE